MKAQYIQTVTVMEEPKWSKNNSCLIIKVSLGFNSGFANVIWSMNGNSFAEAHQIKQKDKLELYDCEVKVNQEVKKDKEGKEILDQLGNKTFYTQTTLFCSYLKKKREFEIKKERLEQENNKEFNAQKQSIETFSDYEITNTATTTDDLDDLDYFTEESIEEENIGE